MRSLDYFDASGPGNEFLFVLSVDLAYDTILTILYADHGIGRDTLLLEGKSTYLP